jgi:hypothetical protein
MACEMLCVDVNHISHWLNYTADTGIRVLSVRRIQMIIGEKVKNLREQKHMAEVILIFRASGTHQQATDIPWTARESSS